MLEACIRKELGVPPKKVELKIVDRAGVCAAPSKIAVERRKLTPREWMRRAAAN